jgi:hypothetical protein
MQGFGHSLSVSIFLMTCGVARLEPAGDADSRPRNALAVLA